MFKLENIEKSLKNEKATRCRPRRLIHGHTESHKSEAHFTLLTFLSREFLGYF